MSNAQLPQTFEERVKLRIRENFMDLIPDDQLQSLVTQQILHFKGTELPKMIKAEIEAQYRAAIRAELESPEYRTTWATNGQRVVSEAIKKVITENASDILVSMIGGVAQSVVYTMQQQNGAVPRY